MVLTPSGGLGLADPDGRHLVITRGVTLDPRHSLVAAADSRYLVNGLGDFIAVEGNRLTVVDTAVTSTLSLNNMIVSGTHPFADSDQALVALTAGKYGNPSSTAAVSVVPLAHLGQTAPLGTGAEAVGDPQAVGAFVTVAAAAGAVAPGSAGLQTEPETQVELRDAGLPPIVLATAAQLNRAVGEDPNRPVSFDIAPDATGDALAIAVDAASGPSAGGLVVVNRAGEVLGSVPPAVGVSNGQAPAWSPDGRSLLYAGFGNSGPDLVVWTLGGPTLTRRAPDPSSSFGTCVWSPDGAAFLCPNAYGPNPPAWVLGAAAGVPLVSVSAPGFPVAWLRQSPAQAGQP